MKPGSGTLRRILIANRGEIAIRVARACRELGIAAVGVYSTADIRSLHLEYLSDAVCIGDPPALASYLNIERIIDAARMLKADAIHPGYGFLAENPEFARACEAASIVFIGPSSRALALVGDKVASRISAKKTGAPLIPGMELKGTRIEEFAAAAQEAGYPVMIKASLGGGGKGIRIVRKPEELAAGVEAGRREAKSAFGDEAVYLEKYIDRPRHIEFQVLRDQHGRVVHLGERECSIQRRHQKIIEETPSPALSAGQRAAMGEAAKKIIAAVDYVNAGTVEFLLDREGRYYFLEVNARVQVEHPITEAVTGFDIVKRQIQIAAGHRLEIQQEEISQRGHAIEARIYAEDAENNFLPAPGKILLLKEPQGPGVRVDSGVYAGWNVPAYYDPILAKLVVWDETRPAAVRRIAAALTKYVILGIKTNIGFLRRIVETPEFLSGDVNTHFIDDNIESMMPRRRLLDAALIAAALALPENRAPDGGGSAAAGSPWSETGKWEIGGR